MDSIWVEKYRPKSLDDIVGNAAATSRLKAAVKEKCMQHLLLCGPAGIGKTSSLHCLARVLLGDKYDKAVLELNAADDRGIDTVRDKIKSFAREVTDLPAGQCKIVILDEVEAMTEAAQQALRRIFEIYGNTTRFALACNQSDKVIDPIQSRCARITMGRISIPEMVIVLAKICVAENVTYTSEALDVIAECAEGDLRKAIGSLQAAATALEKVELPFVYHACDIPPTNTLNAAFTKCRVGDWRGAHDELFALIDKGHSGADILKALRNIVMRSDAPEVVRTHIFKEITFVLMATDRAIDELQLDRALCALCRVSLTAK